MENRFNEHGMWRLPERVEKLDSSEANRETLRIGTVYCPNGHELVSGTEEVSGEAAIVLAFRRPNGERGRVAMSTQLENLAKKVLEGEFVKGERVELSCPICDAVLPVLAQCDRCHTGDMRVLYCSKALSFDDSVAFCDVVGCPNAMLVRSHKIIRALERELM